MVDCSKEKYNSKNNIVKRILLFSIAMVAYLFMYIIIYNTI